MKSGLAVRVIPLIMVLIFACNINQEVDYKVTTPGVSAIEKEIVLVDTLRIRVDSLTSPENYYGHIRIINEAPYYCIFNSYSSTVQAYNLLDPDSNWLVKIAREGPNSVPQIDRVYVHNKDSIFIMSDDFYRMVYLFNSSGIMTNSYTINLPGEYKNYWTCHDYFYDFLYDPQTKTIGFWMYPDNRASEDGYDYYKMARAVRFNLETNELKSFGRYPNVYFADNNLYENFEFINSYETCDFDILYFAASSEIQVYNKATCNIIETLIIPSDWISEPIAPFMKLWQERPAVEEGLGTKYLQETGFFARMLCNADGTLHYRIVKHDVTLKYPDGRKRNWYDQPFSIMVLDKEFKTITEKKFSGGLFDFWQVFAMDNRLYISLNNTLNEYASDDYFQFAVFAIQ